MTQTNLTVASRTLERRGGWGGGGLLGHSNKSFSFSTPRVICGEDDDDASGAIARPPAWKLGHPSASAAAP